MPAPRSSASSMRTKSCLRFSLHLFRSRFAQIFSKSQNCFKTSKHIISLSSRMAAGLGVVVGVGACCVDLLAVVDRFPKPDDKTRTRSLQVHINEK